MNESFGSLLTRYAAEKPASQLALIYPDGAVTWQAFEARATRRAQQLYEMGVRPDDLVAVALPNCAAHHEMTFAIWKAGATPCILPAKLPEQELRQVLALAHPRVLVRDAGYESLDVKVLDPTRPFEIADPVPMPDRAPRHWKAVTSGGSTGRPKLIIDRVEGRFNQYIDGRLERIRMPRGGVMINPGPLYHNASFLFTSLALIAGSTVVGMVRFDAEECLRLIEKHRANWICLVPTMMHRIWSLPKDIREKYDVSSLQAVWHMAAACPTWLKQGWIDWLGPDRIFEAYSGTEASGTTINGRDWLRKPGSVGRIAPGTLSILRPDGEPCAPGEVGEIFFPHDAQARFQYVGASVTSDAQGRFSLGDLGYADDDGYLFLADRRSDLINRGGANIYPAEVEAVLDQNPTVANSVVIGLPCQEYGQRVHAILEPRTGSTCALEEIDRYMRERLASYKCPESYEIAQSPLRNEAGKVRRSALKEEREAWLERGRVFQTMVRRGQVPAPSVQAEAR